MNTPIRNTTLGLGALLLLGLAVAPSAQATSIEVISVPDLVDTAARPICPAYNPDAWFNCSVSVSTTYKTVNAYTVDTTPDYTTVCPVGTICVNVPVVLSFVDAATYSVPLYNLHHSEEVNSDNIIDDACDVIGIVCAFAEPLLNSLASTTSAMPHGMEFVGATEGLAFFELPSGETVVLPTL